MCSTCGCGKKADTFEAPKRQRIGNRFISRRKDGTISKNVNVGRSLSADRRRKAKTTASAGQGDKGDLKRAERQRDSWFEKNHQNFSESKRKLRINPMMQSMKCAECGGRVSCLGPYTNDGERSSSQNDFYVAWCRGCSENSNSAESFGAESKFDKLSNEIAKDYEKKGKSKDEAEEIGKATAYKIGVAKYGKRGMERKARAGRAKNAEEFGAEEVINEYDIDMYSLMTFMAFQDPTELSVVKQAIDEMGCDRDTVRWAIYWWNSNWGGVPEETLNYLGLSESFGADEKKRSGMKIAPKIQMVNYQDVMTEKMKNQNMKDAEEFGADGISTPTETMLDEECGLCGDDLILVDTGQGQIYKTCLGEYCGYILPMNAEEFGADVVQDVKDFDVVGTTQDVVGKTGFNIPTGVASIAVVFMAYMTGKKYGN
jgi:hypothetical protein